MAGFFGFFDYSRPGKGVRKDEPKRSHFSMFWILLQRKFWKVIQVNILFVLSCIPLGAVLYLYSGGILQPAPLVIAAILLSLAPIGPAISGAVYILRNFSTERPVFLWSDFWDSFKNNFKQSAIYFYIMAATATVLYVAGSFYFQNSSENSWMYIPMALIVCMTLLFLFANFYIYLMIVTLDLPLKSIIKNGFLLGTLCLKSNFITLFFVALVVFFFWLYPVIGFLMYLIIGFAFVGFIIVHNSYRGVKKHAIDPYLARLQAAEEGEGEKVFNDEQIIKDDDR